MRNTRKTLLFGLILTLFAMSGCSKYPKKVVDSLDKMNLNNRHKFEKVLKHYIAAGDKEKLKAAYFLVADINDKYGNYYPQNAFFFSILAKVDSLKQLNKQTESVDSLVNRQWEDYCKVQGGKISLESYKDVDIITSDFLIENIDLAFKVWKEKPWAKHLNYDQFCEWILPYRVQTEPIQNWRSFMMDKLSWLGDSLKNPNDPKEVCLLINKYIAKDFQFSHTLSFIPLLGGLDGWKFKSGICDHRYLLIVMAMRSIGIPATIDITPQFPRKSGGHSWTVLLDADGNTKSFNGGEKDAVIFYPNACPIGVDEQVTKVYRQLYSKNEDALALKFPKTEFPETMRSRYIMDVTNQYGGLHKQNITIPLADDYNEKIGFLFSFNIATDVNPVAFSEVKKKTVTFNDVGRDGIYFVGFYKDQGIALGCNPFILPKPEGNIQFINPDLSSFESVRLYRKFSVPYTMKPYIKGMIGARIQGANDPGFSDSVTIYRIANEIDYFKEIEVNPSQSYRYYRYLSADTSNIRIADLALFYKDLSDQKKYVTGRTFGFKSKKDDYDDAVFKNAFDYNIRTNFNAPKGSWAAIDAGRPVKIVTLKILVRNDQNIVEPADTYELLYFNQGWYSLGKQVAQDHYVDFEKVPKGAILLLKDLTKGREERIFKYENGKQVWW
jgi:hypothetical protein